MVCRGSFCHTLILEAVAQMDVQGNAVDCFYRSLFPHGRTGGIHALQFCIRRIYDGQHLGRDHRGGRDKPSCRTCQGFVWRHILRFCRHVGQSIYHCGILAAHLSAYSCHTGRTSHFWHNWLPAVRSTAESCHTKWILHGANRRICIYYCLTG